MSDWSQLSNNLINKIGEYIPPSRCIYIGLVCKRWYKALLPQIYRILPRTFWSKSNCKQILEKYGTHVKELDKCEDFKNNSKTLFDLLKLCPNIENLFLTNLLLKGLKKHQLYELFPNLEFITFDEELHNVKLISKLHRLNTFQFRWNELDYIVQNTPSSVYGQIKKLYLAIPEFDFDDFRSLVKKFANVTYINFLVSDYDTIPHDQVPHLLSLFNLWKSLDSLVIIISLTNYIHTTQSMKDFQIQIPSDFSIQRLKYFSIDIKQRNIVQVRSASTRGNPNQRSEEESYNFNGNIDPKIFYNLFNQPCNQLTKLHLAIIDTKLLEKVSAACPNLWMLTMDSPLPIPTAQTAPFHNLKQLSICGFFKDALNHKDAYIKLFPKVSKLNLETAIYSTWSNSVSCPLYILEFFQNVTTVYFSFHEEQEDEQEFWKKRIPGDFRLRQITIMSSYFDHLVTWLEINASIIESPFTIMIDLTEGEYHNASTYRLVKSCYPQFDFFLCQSSDRFEAYNIQLV